VGVVGEACTEDDPLAAETDRNELERKLFAVQEAKAGFGETSELEDGGTRDVLIEEAWLVVMVVFVAM
jgi:hypothetical protein